MRRNGRVTFSQRTTFAHWLISSGRSRQDWIHLAYIDPMIASEVGRMARRSSSFSAPPCVTHATCGAKPSTCSASFSSRLSGMKQREVGVDVPGRLEPVVERALHLLPDRVAVRADDHAALDRRVVGELGAPDHVQVPLGEVLGLLGDLGNVVSHVAGAGSGSKRCG